MGISKELARKGAVGGTARWGAEIFFSYFAENRFEKFNTNEELRAEIDKLVNYALNIRFQGNLSGNDAILINEMYKTSGRQIGFSGFINSILGAEAGLYKNNQKNILLFMEIVEEELEKANVGPAVIYGDMSAKTRHLSPQKLDGSNRGSSENLNTRANNHIWMWLGAAIVILYIANAF